MCKYVRAVQTKTKFIILMHPKEFKKVKNGSGHLTHLSLPNSELYVGSEFSTHKRVNELIDDKNNNCYLLYPSKDSISLNENAITQKDKTSVIFIIDSTWACSAKLLRLSPNLESLQSISFSSNRSSNFQIKIQPQPNYLSTIESTQYVLELLSASGDEDLSKEQLDGFLNPFNEMIKFQLSCIELDSTTVRYKKRTDGIRERRF